MIRFVSVPLDQQKSLDGQEREQKDCGIRLQTAHEEKDSGSVQQEGEFMLVLHPARITAVLHGKGQDTQCGHCDYRSKVCAFQIRFYSSQR